MNKDEPSLLNADRPIETSTEDVLGRKAFAYRLADQINSWNGKESLVIGLHGSWGSGKSSVKNLVLERLSQTKDVRPKVVPFDPWLISGEDKVAMGFFSELGRALADDTLGGNKEERADSWRRYSRYFESLAKTAETIDYILPLLGVLPGVGKWIAERLQKAGTLASTAADGLESKQDSFESLRRDIKKQFSELKRPLLIVIDDIDRLTSEEIRTVFRLVKANADFPNTVYLLLFQQETVAHALNPICDNQGSEFLKKIVQIELGLPHLSQKDVALFWETKLNSVLGPYVDESNWQAEKFVNLWAGGLSNYICNLRDATRYLNSFAFVICGLHAGGILEVNPIDFLAIEALRIFEPDVYGLLPANKSLLIDRIPDYGKERLKELAELMLSKKRHASDEPLKHILSDLFPNLSTVWKNMGYGSEWRREWTKQRRVCSEQFFDRYFFLSLPDNTLSEETVQHILGNLQDREALKATFTKLALQGLMLETLKRLEAEDRIDKLIDPTAYLLALTDISDELPWSRQGYLTNFPGEIYVRRAVYHILKHMTDVEAKKHLLKNLICQSTSLYLPASWIDDMEKPDEKNVWPTASVEEVIELKKLWLARVKDAANKPEQLLCVSQLAIVLQTWVLWGGDKDLKDWLVVVTRDAHLCLRLLNKFVLRSSSHSMGSAYIRDQSWLSWKSLARYADKSTWQSVSEHIARETELSKDELRMKQLFVEAMGRWDKGIEDDDSRKFEND